MIESITPTVLGDVFRGGKVTAATGGNFAAYVDLSNMQAGDEVAFWLEYDIAGQDIPRTSGTAMTITYEELDTKLNEGQPNEVVLVTDAWALEPVALQAGQVSQIALVQTAGVLREFPIRNTNMATHT